VLDFRSDSFSGCDLAMAPLGPVTVCEARTAIGRTRESSSSCCPHTVPCGRLHDVVATRTVREHTSQNTHVHSTSARRTSCFLHRQSTWVNHVSRLFPDSSSQLWRKIGIRSPTAGRYKLKSLGAAWEQGLHTQVHEHHLCFT